MKRASSSAQPFAQLLSRCTSILPSAKRTLLSTMLGLGLSGAALAGTTEGAALPVLVQTADQHSIRVRISNPAQQLGRVQVLRQGSGQLLFSQDYSATEYGHRFDFQNVSAGRYVVLVTIGPQQYRYVVQVQTINHQPTVAIRTIKVRLPKTEALAAL